MLKPTLDPRASAGPRSFLCGALDDLDAAACAPAMHTNTHRRRIVAARSTVLTTVEEDLRSKPEPAEEKKRNVPL
jgi:hypothetical protein